MRLAARGAVRRMARHRYALAVVGFVAFATAAVAFGPRAFEAGFLLASQDDPVALSDHALSKSFDAAVATREIESALAAGDAELAASFLDLARDRGVVMPDHLIEQVTSANAASASALRAVGQFAHGFVVGEPDDMAGLVGTVAGDLFVFGDVRDAVREGVRFASGEKADELILGLACVGIAVTAGTYATLAAGTPARAGLSLMKAARKSGRIGTEMAEGLGRSLREVVDGPALRHAFASASLTRPAVAVRAAREAVKVEKAQGLVRFVGDVGRVQAKAGTRTALDGLKVSRTPRDMTRVARLAEAKGTQTRAILKLLGRGAIALTAALFDLALWLLWAAVTLFGLVSSLKATVERATARYLSGRRRRRARAERALAALAARG